MNKKKRIAILFAVIIILAVGIIIAVASHQKKEMDFDEFADRFEKSANEVLGEDLKKVSKTEVAATLTYGDQTDKDRTIYYRILKTTFYDGDPAEITGLHTEALGVLFPVDSMDSCEEMMIKDWHGAVGAIFANLLVGEASPIPFEHHLPMMATRFSIVSKRTVE